MTAYLNTLHGTLNKIPDHTPKLNTVRKSAVENKAKNVIEVLPLLLQRKCHKLCSNNEINIKINAVKVIFQPP